MKSRYTAKQKAESVIPFKNNLKITIRERGKIVGRREGHNIWLNAGRVYLAQLMSFASYTGPVYQNSNRIRYMGLGIGGNKQSSLGVANAFPLGPTGAPGPIPNGYYPGTNVQTDTNPAVTQLERPVRISSTDPMNPSTPPGYADAGEIWLGQVAAPPVHSPATSVTFTRTFVEGEISYGPFMTVPLSEIGLFTDNPSGSYPHLPFNAPVAYDTFSPISKTQAFSLEVDWTVRFLGASDDLQVPSLRCS